MKKLLFIFLFISGLANAQINLDNVCKFTEIEAKQFADEIAKNANAQYRLYKLYETSTKTNYIYIPSNVSDEDAQNNGYDHYNPIEISYHIIMEGQNKDLNIEGIKKYKLERAYGQFLNLFHFWKKNYVPEISTENYKDYKMKEVHRGKLFMKFIDDGDGDWFITPFYCS